MKKNLSVFVLLCLLTSLCALFASCNHECTFSDEWSSDAKKHWHVCNVKGCDKIADEAAHTWDEGKPSDDGTVYTCTVCAKTKKDESAAALTEAEWNAAFSAANFVNFTYVETATVTGSGFSMETIATSKISEDAAWAEVSVMGQKQEEFTTEASEIAAARDGFMQSIEGLTNYASYTFDKESKTYKAIEPLKLAALDAFAEDITLTFENGKLVKMEYSCEVVESGITMNAISTVVISDYGTTVVSASGN